MDIQTDLLIDIVAPLVVPSLHEFIVKHHILLELVEQVDTEASGTLEQRRVASTPSVYASENIPEAILFSIRHHDLSVQCFESC